MPQDVTAKAAHACGDDELLLDCVRGGNGDDAEV